MKLDSKDVYHGAALTQLVEHPSFTALNKADTKYGHYLVNADKRLLVKHSAKTSGPWQFTFQPDDLATLAMDLESGFETFAVLACGKTTVCLLCDSDLLQAIDVDADQQQWIRVEIPKASMRVSGSAGKVRRATRHSWFPGTIFEQ